MALPEIGLKAVIENIAGFEKSAGVIVKAYGQMDAGAKQVEKSSSGLGNAVSKLGSGMLSFGKIAAGVAIGGVTLLGGGLVALGTKAVSSAADVAEMQSLFNTAFGEDAPRARQAIDDFAAAVGRNKFELEGFAGGIKSILTPMGVAQEAATDMSVNFSQLAVDLSSFYNVTESDALEALRSGLIGETEPLRKFGVVLNQAAIEQEALNMGLFDGKGQMDAATKAAATYALIMKQTELAQGDAARTSGSWVNQTRALQAAIDEAVVEIGMQLIPVLTPLLKQFTAMVKEYLPRLVEWFKVNLPIAIQTASDFWNNVLYPTIEAAQAVFKSFSKGSDTVSKTFDKITKAIKPVVDKVLPELLDIFEIINKWVKKNWPLIQKTIEKVLDVLYDIFKKFTKDVAAFWDEWGDIIIKYTDFIFNTIFKIIKVGLENALDVITLIMQIITGDWSGAWDTIQKITERSTKAIVSIVDDAMDVMLDVIAKIMSSVLNTITSVWNNIVSTVKDKVDDVVDAVRNGFNQLPGVISGFASQLYNAARTMIQGAINGITSMLTNLVTSLTSTVQSAVSSLLSSITGGSIYSTLISIGQNIINKIREGINAAVSLASTLRDKIAAWINEVATTAGSIWTAAYNLGKSIIAKIIDGIQSVTSFVNDLRTTISNWLTSVVNSLGGIATAAYNMGRKIIDQLLSGVSSMSGQFITWIKQKIEEWLGDVFSPIPSAQHMGEKIIDNVLLGLAAQKSGFITAVKNNLSDWIALAGTGATIGIVPQLAGGAIGGLGSFNTPVAATPTGGGGGQTIINNNVFNMGGNTIAGGMDAAQFEAGVLNVIRRNL